MGSAEGRFNVGDRKLKKKTSLRGNLGGSAVSNWQYGCALTCFRTVVLAGDFRSTGYRKILPGKGYVCIG